MKFRNLSISKQIIIWMSAILFIIVGLAVYALVSMEGMWFNTSEMYDHPLTVRRAVGIIEVNVLLIHRDMRQLPFEND